MPCLKTSSCYSVHTELQTHLFLGSVRVFSVMKRTTLASCQGTESCPGDDLLNSTVCSWTYSWVIRTGRDLKNHSALLFYIWETQNLNWWVPSSVSNEWKARSPDANLGLLMPNFYWINWLFHCIDAVKRCWLKNVLWNDKIVGYFFDTQDNDSYLPERSQYQWPLTPKCPDCYRKQQYQSKMACLTNPAVWFHGLVYTG